jgi:hypothetical protein
MIIEVQRKLGTKPAATVWAPASTEASAKKTHNKRTMSPEARAKVAAAQKKRWAAFHRAQSQTTTTKNAAKKA